MAVKEKTSLYLLGIVGIVAVVGVIVLIFGGQKAELVKIIETEEQALIGGVVAGPIEGAVPTTSFKSGSAPDLKIVDVVLQEPGFLWLEDSCAISLPFSVEYKNIGKDYSMRESKMHGGKSRISFNSFNISGNLTFGTTILTNTTTESGSSNLTTLNTGVLHTKILRYELPWDVVQEIKLLPESSSFEIDINAYIDSEDSISETNEKNNEYSSTLSLYSRDLSIVDAYEVLASEEVRERCYGT